MQICFWTHSPEDNGERLKVRNRRPSFVARHTYLFESTP
jgi:hypothetical protein